jgi:F0F1-type ATP synthase epsilon subunit
MANHLDAPIDQTKTIKQASKNQLKVLVYAPFRTYFDGLADSVTSKNAKGVFDVLPLHHSFITLLDPGNVTINSKLGEQKIEIDKGLMHVNENQVTVFLDV